MTDIFQWWTGPRSISKVEYSNNIERVSCLFFVAFFGVQDENKHIGTYNKVCRYLYISPAYFSSIFKKETKMTFMNYLLYVRMSAAKELLQIPDMKTFEIAKKVGYSEANYFSYCFKKNFGISPTEYRNSIYL